MSEKYTLKSKLRYKPILFFNIHPDYISCARLFSIKLSLLHSVYTHKIARLVWGRDLTIRLIPSPKQWRVLG